MSDLPQDLKILFYVLLKFLIRNICMQSNQYIYIYLIHIIYIYAKASRDTKIAIKCFYSEKGQI